MINERIKDKTNIQCGKTTNLYYIVPIYKYYNISIFNYLKSKMPNSYFWHMHTYTYIINKKSKVHVFTTKQCNDFNKLGNWSSRIKVPPWYFES